MKFLSTTIPRLDESIGGGLPLKKISIFWSYPGVENSPFVYQIMMNGLKKKFSCVYVVNNKPYSTVKKEVYNFGWDLDKYEKAKKFLFVDAYSKLVNSEPQKGCCLVKDPKSFESLIAAIDTCIKEIDGEEKIMIFDNLSTMIDMMGDDVIGKMNDLKKILDKHNAAAIFLFTNWNYKPEVIKKLNSVSDIIVDIRAIEEKVILRKYYKVAKDINGREKDLSVPFKLVRPGGVMVYIPKILVTGPFNAGKSSFIHSASDTSVSVDRFGTTIALDHGHLDYSGFSVDIFGTPGQERFDPILELLGGQSLGVIIIVDSTAPETFPRAKDMLMKTKTSGLPFVIVANKADLPGALNVKEIDEIFKFNAEHAIIPVHAKNKKKIPKQGYCELNKEDVKKVLDALFDNILRLD